MRPAVVTAVLLLVGVLNIVTTVHGLDSAKAFCNNLYQDEPCGDGWSRIDAKRCAKFFDSPKTFKDAQEHCRTFNSDLVSIHNLLEMLKVNCITLRDNSELQTYWIGAQRSGEAFTFIDGSEFNYENGWFYNQPNNQGGQENCVESNAKMWAYWNDDDCTEENEFVCAKEM